MEWIRAEIIHSQRLDVKDIDSCRFSSCPFHDIRFAVDDQNRIISFNNTISDTIQLSSRISRIINTCTREQDQCRFYFQTLSNKVYLWEAINSSLDQPRKRAKLSDSAEQHNLTLLREVASDIQHMFFHQNALILFSCSKKVTQLDLQTEQISDATHEFNFEDCNIMYTQSVSQPLDVCLMNFFGLSSSEPGFLYSAKNGCVYWRNTATKEDIRLERFEGSEQIKKLDIACVPELSDACNALLFFGDQGTIKLYIKASSNDTAAVTFKQFNIDDPLFSIIKIKNLHYLVSSGLGKISLLKFDYTRKNSIELDATSMQGITKAHHLISSNQHHIDAVILNAQNKPTMVQIQYNPTPVSIENDEDALRQCIETSLQELEQSESIVRSMDLKEQELNQKLASTNRTLYALRSIHHKRQIGICNSLSQTGFEFSVRPITRSNSYENCMVNTTAHLRICIKTGRFLELEHWHLVLHLEPMSTQQGQIKTIPVIGFESHYDNGIERYIVWERDIEIDVCLLPFTMKATMLMTLEGGSEAPFPVCEMILDDLHFAKPCSENLREGIERRGLEEISARLMQSYEQQQKYDLSGKYPFARLMQKQQQKKPLFSNYGNVHILYSIDASMTDEQYRSILATILGEGHTEQNVQHILSGGAEQALFSLAAYPASPILIKLSKVSSTIIDFNVQCAYVPALFKIEATLLQRVHQYFMDNDIVDRDATFLKKLKTVEEQVYQLQEIYQQLPSEQNDMMDIDQDEKKFDLHSQIKKAMDLFYDIHKETPIGHLVFPDT